MVGFADAIATARTYAQMNGYTIDANRELVALGAENLAAGFSAGFPVASCER